MAQQTTQDRALTTMTSAVTEAAAAFESRWTLAGLRRTNPDIGGRLHAQAALWREALSSASAEAIEKQGGALVRGYRKAVEVMSIVEPDSYVVGRCPDSGFTLVIGHCPATAKEAAEAEGEGAVWLTPDEVANLLPKLSGFSTLAAIKRAFPGALTLPEADRLTASEAARKAKIGADSHG